MREKGPLAVFDIDGTICDFVAGFAAFAGRGFTRETYDVRLACGISDLEEGDAMVDRYYKSGRLSVAPTIDVAMTDLIREVYEKATVMLLTARPSNLYPYIVSDTWEWLTHNKVPCDILAFAEKKYEFLFGENVDYVVEDNLDQAMTLAASGHVVYLIDRPYNQSDKTHKNLIRVKSADEIKTYVKDCHRE